MTVLISILIVAIVLILIIYTCLWINHVTNSRSEYRQSGFASFHQFLKIFKTYEENCRCEESVYNEIIYKTRYGSNREKVLIRYYIITFENNIMILHYLDYWKFLIWFNQQFLKPKPDKHFNWNDFQSGSK